MRNNIRILIFFILILGMSACHPKPRLGVNIPIRIMPMGDSITEGMCDTPSIDNCYVSTVKTPVSDGLAACSWAANPDSPKAVGYRAFLRDKLVAKGVKIAYVGSVSVVEGLAHEGHSAWTIGDIDYCVQNADWLQKAQPDMILLHIGSNDVSWGHSPDTMVSDLSQLLEHIYDKLPKTTYVIVAQIIPVDSHLQEGFVSLQTLMNDIIAQYNTKIPGVVDQFRKDGKNIFYVDMSSAIQSDSDFTDRVHPNTIAAERMAGVWRSKIMEVLKGQ